MAIKECDCQHEFQDEEYGQQNRVHNFAPKGYHGRAGWRCTVCSKVKPNVERKGTDERTE